MARSWGQGGLPCHDLEVERVVVKDDAVLELRVLCCTCNAQAHVTSVRMYRLFIQLRIIAIGDQ